MGKTIGRKRPPTTDSIEELAKFWDTHDLADFEGNLEEVNEPVFVRSEGTSLRVELPPQDAEQLKQIALSEGTEETTLLRQWILDRLHESSSTKRRRSGKSASPGARRG